MILNQKKLILIISITLIFPIIFSSSIFGKNKNQDPKIEIAKLIKKYQAIPFSDRNKKTEKGKAVHFIPGDKIAHQFEIDFIKNEKGEINLQKLSLRAKTSDIRYADYFIVEVSLDDFRHYAKFQGISLYGVVEVLEKGKYIGNWNQGEFKAAILTLYSKALINPPNINSLSYGTDVIIRGKITEHEVIDKYDGEDNTKLMCIVTDDKKVFYIQTQRNIQYEDCPYVLENLCGKKPMIGDKVKIKTDIYRFECYNMTSEIQEKPYLKSLLKLKNKKILYASWCRSLYLEKPSLKRITQYVHTRSLCYELLQKIKVEKNYTKKRKIIGYLMKQEMTVAEKGKLIKLSTNMPKNERTTMIWDRFSMGYFREGYSVDPDIMTVKEYINFVDKTLNRMFFKDKKRKSASYILRLINSISDFPIKEKERLFLKAARTRWELFKKMNYSDGNYDSKYSNDTYITRRGLAYAISLGTENSLKASLVIIKDIIDYEKTHDKKGYFCFEACHQLMYIAKEVIFINPKLSSIIKNEKEYIENTIKQFSKDKSKYSIELYLLKKTKKFIDEN